MTTKTNNTTKTIRKPTATNKSVKASGGSPKNPGKRTGTDKPKATLVKVPASLADIKLSKSGRRTVADEIQAQMLKLSKGVEATLKAYCAIGDALVIAKAAVEAGGGSWKKFMAAKPLGLAYSTAQRYVQASEFGADKAIAAFKASGGEVLNFKALLSDMKSDDDAEKGKKPHANRKPQQPKADKPAMKVADLPPLATAVSDELVDSLVDTVVPSMTAAQAERLSLALAVRLEELNAIDGEAEAA